MTLANIFRKKQATAQPLSAPIPIIEVVARPPEYASTLASLKNQCIALGLQKMFEQSHFSICDVDKFAKASNIIIDRDIYDALDCLHCVHWRNMPVETRQLVYGILGELFGKA